MWYEKILVKSGKETSLEHFCYLPFGPFQGLQTEKTIALLLNVKALVFDKYHS